MRGMPDAGSKWSRWRHLPAAGSESRPKAILSRTRAGSLPHPDPYQWSTRMWRVRASGSGRLRREGRVGSQFLRRGVTDADAVFSSRRAWARCELRGCLRSHVAEYVWCLGHGRCPSDGAGLQRTLRARGDSARASRVAGAIRFLLSDGYTWPARSWRYDRGSGDSWRVPKCRCGTRRSRRLDGQTTGGPARQFPVPAARAQPRQARSPPPGPRGTGGRKGVGPDQGSCGAGVPVAARQKTRMAQGDAVVHIRADHLAAIEVPLPPFPNNTPPPPPSPTWTPRSPLSTTASTRPARSNRV